MNVRRKINRRNRRQLDPSLPKPQVSAVVTPTVSTVTVTLTYNVPVVVVGTPAFSVATVTVNSFTVISPTVVHLTLSATGAGKAWVQAADDPNVRTYTGGKVAAAAGTFP